MAGRDTFLNYSAPIMFQFSTESILCSVGKEHFVYFHLVGEIISVLSMLYVGLRRPGRCHSRAVQGKGSKNVSDRFGFLATH